MRCGGAVRMPVSVACTDVIVRKGHALWGCSANASECGVYGCDCEEGP
jgi:tRNA A37 threonylcarbamoyladenosine synthetase subunit TsaC/SUA5/YrdC